ncbi:hypothetical protein [Desulfosporosinus acidiphilus]|nr:hypothetical protein [Desulfosporosinus acidiphilus]
MRNREKQRELRRKERREFGLDSKNAFGVNDPTPKQAISKILKDRSDK